MQIRSGERQLQYPYQVVVETLQIDEIAQGEAEEENMLTESVKLFPSSR